MPLTALRPTDPVHVGRLRLLARLGEGGMGTVYLGVGDDLKAVAVKVLRDATADPDSRQRFRRELDALQRVRGPHLVELLHADLDHDPPHLVTGFVPGERLDHLVHREGRFQGEAAVRLARGMADAVVALHAAGITHRDLTPGNVLVLDGEAHVIDLGLASAREQTSVTRTGLLIGTPAYLAPEQVRGTELTPAVDVHAWGATVAFACTGRPPFGVGRPEAVLYRIVHEEPALDGVPRELHGLVEAALHPDPGRRPSARVLLERLGGSTHAAPVTVRLPQDIDATAVLARPVHDHTSTTQLRHEVPATVTMQTPTRALPTRLTTSVLSSPARIDERAGTDASSDRTPVGPCGDNPRRPDAHEPHRHETRTRQHVPAAYEPDEWDTPDHPPVHWSDPSWEPGPLAWAPQDEPVPPHSRGRSLQVVTTTAAGLAVVGAGTLVAPVVGVAAVLLVLVVLRAASRSGERYERRRERRGPRRRDPLVRVLGAPWQAVVGLLDTALSVPLLLALAALPAGALYLTGTQVAGVEPPELALATASVVGLLVGLSRPAHRRSRRLLRGTLLALAPGPAGALLIIGLLALAALLLLGATQGAAATWWPLTAPLR